MQQAIFVTGLSGLLGSNLARICAAAGLPVSGTVHQHSVNIPGVCQITADLSASYEIPLDRDRKGFVMHCAAATNVDWCEQNEANAHLLNVEATRRLASQTTRSGWRFVYISTDSVFDGARGKYSEDDVPAPVNVYARSKLDGEQAALAEAPDALIIRTNFYGQNRGAKLSLAEWLLDRLSAGARIDGFDDVDIQPALGQRSRFAHPETYSDRSNRLVSPGRFRSLQQVRFCDEDRPRIPSGSSLVTRSSIQSLGLVAKRPLNTSLDTIKASRALGCKLPTVDEGIQSFRQSAEPITGSVRALAVLD